MPDLVRLYIRHVAIGYALAAVFTGLILGTNVANLWHLVTHTDGGWLAAFLLFMFNGIVFSGVQFGIAVMRMAEPEDRDGGRRTRVTGELVPVRIPTEVSRSG